MLADTYTKTHTHTRARAYARTAKEGMCQYSEEWWRVEEGQRQGVCYIALGLGSEWAGVGVRGTPKPQRSKEQEKNSPCNMWPSTFLEKNVHMPTDEGALHPCWAQAHRCTLRHCAGERERQREC